MTPLVLVHGFMGGSAQWDGCLQNLQYISEVIAIDLPGYGDNNTTQPLDSIVENANWVINYLKILGVTQYHLLGHSMGGMIVQEMAVRDSKAVRRLILYATGALGELPDRFESIDESKRRANLDGAKATARRISATWFLKYETAKGYDHCAAIAQKSSLKVIHSGLTAMQTWSGLANLQNIRQETLVLWGDQDRTYPWDQIYRLWSKIPNTSLAVIPNCSHALHAENPAMFETFLNTFLVE